MDPVALGLIAIGWLISGSMAVVLAREFRDPGTRPRAWVVLVVAIALAVSPSLLEAPGRGAFSVGQALVLTVAVFGVAALLVYFIVFLGSADFSPAARTDDLRLAMTRSIAFLAGLLLTAAGHDLVTRLLSPGGLRDFRAGSWVVMGAILALVILPGALLAFRRSTAARMPLYQPALMGAVYWTLFLSLAALPFTGVGRSALGLLALLAGPFAVAWAGCALLEQRARPDLTVP